jgi:hypothetical protein
MAKQLNTYGWKKAILITIFEVIFAITIGGIAYRILILTFK